MMVAVVVAMVVVLVVMVMVMMMMMMMMVMKDENPQFICIMNENSALFNSAIIFLN
jgi:hypothetical protein